MTGLQLYLAIGIPIAVNAVLIGLLAAFFHAKFDGLYGRFSGVNRRFDGVGQCFDGFNRRFDRLRDSWLSELQRFEEALDARLRHIEEERR